MARLESERGGKDHDGAGAHRRTPVPAAVRIRGTVAGPASPADLRLVEGKRRAGAPARSARRVGPLGRRPLTYLLDSVILIDHFNGWQEATRFLQEHGGEAALSVITRAEVLAGFDPDGSVLATALLDRFPVLAM